MDKIIQLYEQKVELLTLEIEATKRLDIAVMANNKARITEYLNDINRIHSLLEVTNKAIKIAESIYEMEQICF